MAKAIESDDEFLARVRPPFITKADRARIMRMMAGEARALGDGDSADRLLRDLEASGEGLPGLSGPVAR